MNIKFRKYEESDFAALARCMEELQDFLKAIDPLHRSRRLARYGKSYTDNLVRKINKHNGLIILACDQGKVIGCIAGVLEKQTKDNLLECVPTKSGRVEELFVQDEYRNHGVGRELMNRMEDYFRKNGCSVVRVAVFAPNMAAHRFYLALDYQDRTVNMIKLLE